MHSSIYKYFLNCGDHIECFMCQYNYRNNAPLSTLPRNAYAPSMATALDALPQRMCMKEPSTKLIWSTHTSILISTPLPYPLAVESPLRNY
ncbi:hypothetical protein DSO57_1029138 [Entomophthora muscae]|uniref:Uncharacterized protein n=1 Tax=Entomophthora muscae TaxID=34485 RepID=A0ACC2TCX8_9FUNG|nr:hypothetical protein DSO57_1029138 [Entomophthora muscae]